MHVRVALNLAGKQSEAANLLKHLTENAVTENRYDTLPKLERKIQTIILYFADSMMLATTTGSCARLIWKLQVLPVVEFVLEDGTRYVPTMTFICLKNMMS